MSAADSSSGQDSADTRDCSGRCRYTSYDELYGYCYKVAGTVALMTTPVMGINPAYDVSSCCSHGLSTDTICRANWAATSVTESNDCVQQLKRSTGHPSWSALDWLVRLDADKTKKLSLSPSLSVKF